jgi:hypothetical protein
MAKKTKAVTTNYGEYDDVNDNDNDSDDDGDSGDYNDDNGDGGGSSWRANQWRGVGQAAGGQGGGNGNKSEMGTMWV